MLKSGSLTAVVFWTIIGCPPKYVQADVYWQFAQSRSAQAPTAPAPARPGEAASPPQRTPGIKQFTEELTALAEQRKKQLEALNGEIQEGLQTEQRATEIFDGMARALKELIEKLGPDSDFRKNLDDLLGRSKKNAEEYAARREPGFQELADRNKAIATDVEKMIRDANAEYARGLAAISTLGSGRDLAVAQIKTDALKAAKDAAEKYIGIVRSVVDQIEQFAKDARVPAAGF